MWWIRQAIQEAIAEQGRNVRIGRNSDAALSRFRRARARLTGHLGRVPTEQELAAEIQMEPDQIRRLGAMILPEVRLDAPVYDAEGPTHGERLGADEAPDAVELLHEAETVRLVEAALRKLQPRDAKVVRLYFGIGDEREHTMEEIGGMIGVTRERVRQIRDRALKLMYGDLRLFRAFAGPAGRNPKLRD